MKRLQRLLIAPRRIDLVNEANLFDYFFLTSIIGMGLFLSIAAFITTIHYRYEDAIQQFHYQAGQVHSLVMSKAASQDLQLEVLSKFIVTNRSISSSRQLQWLNLRVQETHFSCVSLLRVDPKSNLLWQEKVLKTAPGCHRHDPNEPVVAFSMVERNAKGLLSVKRVLALDGGETYLAVTLPHDVLLPTESSEAQQIAVVFEPAPAKNSVGGFFVTEEVLLLGEKLSVNYRPTAENTTLNVGSAWAVLAVGMLITFLIGAIVFSLINRNIAVQKEVSVKTLDLREATEKAVQANQTKSRFLANVSHEVRTPLNLILGMAEVLSETPVTPEQRNYIEAFRRAGNHLLELISDVLDVASIEAGEVPYEEHEMSLVELMENVSDFVSVACRVKKLSYDYTIDPGVPHLVLGDSKRLRQVLINLINNAMKFTDRGGILLRLSSRSLTSTGQHELLFEVQDTGIGIAQSELIKIFDEFYQVNSSSTRARAGVGLGLSIVKTYVDHLRGRIEVESEVGKGTKFKVYLPLQVRDETTWIEALRHQHSPEGTPRVLVVTPNLIQSGFIRSTLEPLGYQVTVVEAGRVALKQLAKSRSTYSHFIIDLVGQDLGGIEVLKKAEFTTKELKRVIALCPIVHRAKDPEILKELGVSNVTYAPIKMSGLLSALKNDSKDSERRTGVTIEPVITALPSGIRLLIAEDDEDNRFLLQTYLAPFDIEVIFAVDGKAALERYQTLAPEVDMLITDIQMPNMDGFELIHAVREYEAVKNLKNIPIVALTADAQSEQMAEVKALGGNEYITKPIAKGQLLNLLTRFRVAS